MHLFLSVAYFLILLLLLDPLISVYTWGAQFGQVAIPPDMQGVAGVYVGCVEGRGSSLQDGADAHTHMDGEFKGWVCFGEKTFLSFRELRLHELAHALTGHDHTDVWRAKLIELGGTVPSKYQGPTA